MKTQRARALIGSLILTFAMVGVVLADAGNPATVNAPVLSGPNNLTVTLSGTWSWNRDNCDRFVGWAIDWDDPAAAGNRIATSDFYVGTPTDNTVHTAMNCGNPPGQSGTWGPISHTYAQAGTYQACAVIYDLHLETKKTDKLNGAINASVTTITLDSTSGIAVGDILKIDDEYLTVVTVASATSLTVQRGTNGSTAASHSDNKDVSTVTIKDGDLVAGGSGRNDDNSVEKNYLKDQSGCAPVTIVITTPTPSPTPQSSVAGATLPPTDQLGSTAGKGDSLGLVLMILAGILASIMVLTPARARRR